MVGYFVTQGNRPRFFREEVLGLPLLRGQLPRRGDPARWERKGLLFFQRAGVRCLLNGPESAALPLAETGSLYRRKAAEIALLELERRGVPPNEAVVGLWASRTSRELEAACRVLAGRVRALALELPERETLSWVLQQDYGIPVFRGEGTVTLCFTPAPPQGGPLARKCRLTAGENRLLLGERRPNVPGVTFVAPEVELPPGCPATPLLALLGEPGRLGWEQIQVQISQGGEL
ncbi:MAG: hypothetical protein LUF86_01500 [Clostridiales bacterium]|nr:hypothetical protein [Clostridiales bacterium]